MRLVIIGGGYSGVSMAVQTARRASRALDIRVVEPARALGRGPAYGTTDPDHRINGPMAGHSVDLNDLEHPHAWVERVGLRADDPALEAPEGLFPRRRDFARYLADSFADHARSNPSGSTLTHVRDRVVDILTDPCDPSSPGGLQLVLGDGGRLAADALVLATGNPPARVPAAVAGLVDHPAMIADPWQAGRIAGIDPQARVIIMGTGLTAADVLATLVRQGHHGPIEAFSRRALRPREQRPVEPVPNDLPPTWLIDRINGAVPDFLAVDADRARSMRGLTRALRERIAQVQAQGRSWQVGFDELRDVVWQVWPQLPVREQRRFLARLRPWYDVHRFRMAPQTTALIEPAEAAGQIHFRAAHLESVSAGDAPSGSLWVRTRDRHGARDSRQCEAFINCTGLDIGGSPGPGTLMARLLARAWLTPDPSGVGYVVDDQNRIVPSGIRLPQDIRLIGPPTAGHFGDPLGVLFIAAQIHRLLPGLLHQLRA